MSPAFLDSLLKVTTAAGLPTAAVGMSLRLPNSSLGLTVTPIERRPVAVVGGVGLLDFVRYVERSEPYVIRRGR